VAAISHLPHLVAAVLAECTPTANLPMAAAGWSDSTRIAAGKPDLWADIFHANRKRVLAALDRYEKSLSRFRRALERDDRAALIKLLEKAKNNRDAVAN
jgi:prephenate dehydrogenase